VETAAPRRGRTPKRTAVQITARDRRMLAFAAEHRFVIAAQPAALLDASVAAAETRLRALAAAGYLIREPTLAGEPVAYRITPQGLRTIASDLPAPRAPSLGGYDHDLGLGWLMVAAHRGRFGPLRAIVSERRMRSDDRRSDHRRADRGAEVGLADGDEALGEGRVRHGVRLGGTGPGGQERLHYPDMVILAETGHRIAFELELTTKARVRREGILAGYAADRHIDLVVYLVAEPRVGQEIERSAARVGIPQLVRVQRVVAGRASRTASSGRGADRRADVVRPAGAVR
jgi:hypothetical protein